MVVLKEIKSMFWGVTLDGGKRYSQTVDQSFHISMAAVEASQEFEQKQKNPVSVMIEHDNAEFVLCTLHPGKVYQQPLDLNFTEGEEVALFLNGNGCVHLTGYLIEDDQYDQPPYDDDDSMEESSDEDVPVLKEAALADDDDDSDEDDDDFDPNILLQSDDDDDEEESDEEVDSDEVEAAINAKRKLKAIEQGQKKKMKTSESSDEESEEDDEDDEPVPQLNKSKQSKVTPSKSDVPQNGSGDAPSKKKKKKKKKNKDNKTDTPSTPNTPAAAANAKKQGTPSTQAAATKKQVLSGNILIEDNKEGHGQVAKPGNKAHVYYIGKLENGKQFDSCEKGKPFMFTLGKDEVIKGWDLGIRGMKVGGRRRITVPPKMGYGKQKMGPIPKNSTLVFDVELKAVS